MYLTIKGKYIHTPKTKLHAHAWACPHTYTSTHKMPGVSNIRKLNTVRFKNESLYVTFSTKMLKSFRFERAH